MISKFNMLNIQTTSSKRPNIVRLIVQKLRQHMLYEVQSELTQDHEVSIILKRRVSQNSWENNVTNTIKA